MAPAPERWIDLRSDTVTRPSPAMYQAMAEAPLGDDVYGDDPTVNKLQARAADLLGFEATVLFPTATQSNLAALLSHCGRGDEVIAGARYHVISSEAGGAAALGGIVPCPLPITAAGSMAPGDVEAAIKPDDPHYPRTRLVCLENTWDGRVVPPEDIHAVQAIARAHGLALHLDGARLMNAAVALGRPARDLAAGFDSVTLCLSKGLGGPAGALLCASAEFAGRARRARKILGGALRQAGLIAACGLVALDHQVAGLAADHANARRLAEGLAGLDWLRVDVAGVHTNMVFLDLLAGDPGALTEYAAARGIKLRSRRSGMRLVTHRDVSAADIDTVLAAFRGFAAGRPASAAE